MELRHGGATLVAFVLIGLWGCGALGSAQSAKSDHGIMLTLHPVKEEFNVGEPVVIEARIHNTNDQEAILPDFRTARRALRDFEPDRRYA